MCDRLYFKKYWRENNITVEFPFELNFFDCWEPGKDYYKEDNFKYRLSDTDQSHLSELRHRTFGESVSKSLKLFFPKINK